MPLPFPFFINLFKALKVSLTSHFPFIDIRSAFNALDQETNNHVLVLFQMKSSNLSIESPLSTKTASDSGKYLTPEIFLALCILFIFIVGVLVAYQMTDAVQTPTQWVEKPLNVGKLY